VSQEQQEMNEELLQETEAILNAMFRSGWRAEDIVVLCQATGVQQQHIGLKPKLKD
jgi:hypothetical protein